VENQYFTDKQNHTYKYNGLQHSWYVNSDSQSHAFQTQYIHRKIFSGPETWNEFI